MTIKWNNPWKLLSLSTGLRNVVRTFHMLDVFVAVTRVVAQWRWQRGPSELSSWRWESGVLQVGWYFTSTWVIPPSCSFTPLPLWIDLHITTPSRNAHIFKGRNLPPNHTQSSQLGCSLTSLPCDSPSMEQLPGIRKGTKALWTCCWNKLTPLLRHILKTSLQSLNCILQYIQQIYLYN